MTDKIVIGSKVVFPHWNKGFMIGVVSHRFDDNDLTPCSDGIEVLIEVKGYKGYYRRYTTLVRLATKLDMVLDDSEDDK